MSVVGKLLVFLNLVFSLVVGTFAVMDYTARTHWKDSHDKISAQLAIEKGTSASYRAEAERFSKERAELNEKLRAALGKEFEVTRPEDVARVAPLLAAEFTTRKQHAEQLEAQIKLLREELKGEKAKILAYETASLTSQKNVEARQTDVRKLEDLLVAETKAKTALTLERNRMRDEKVAAEIESMALRDKNLQMLARLTELEKELAVIKSQPPGAIVRRPGGGPLAAPPADHLEGRITQVESNLVRISLGSDNGLAKDNILEVFRLGDKPKYLGKIRIVSLYPDTAVGQVEGRSHGPMQKDDRVATKIIGGK
jgi:hypothetical protein